MRREEFERLTHADQVMWLAFGSFDPCLAALPHCLFVAEAGVLATVSGVTGSKVGLWGNAEPFYDPWGGPHLPPPGTPAHADFTLWETPANQAEALRLGESRSGGGFVAALDSRTPARVLDEMYARLPASEGTSLYDYLTCINLLCEWVEQLGWAYVPLDDEYGHAMFVTSARDAPLVRRVEEALAGRGVRTSRLERREGRFHWKDFEAPAPQE
jgi:hypothetical protein